MIFTIATFLVNRFGLDFAKATRIAWILLAVGAFLLILASVFVFRSCGGSDSIGEKEIQRQQQEIEKREAEKLTNTIQKSNEVLANAANAVQQSEANTNNALNKDFSNTNMTEAEKARCRAYPSSRGCAK